MDRERERVAVQEEDDKEREQASKPNPKTELINSTVSRMLGLRSPEEIFKHSSYIGATASLTAMQLFFFIYLYYYYYSKLH